MPARFRETQPIVDGAEEAMPHQRCVQKLSDPMISLLEFCFNNRDIVFVAAHLAQRSLRLTGSEII